MTEPSRALALLGDLEQAGALTPVGLRLTVEIPYAQYESLCEMFGQLHGAVQFAAGDLILYGEQLYGETCYQALEQLRVSPDTRARYRRVSARVPLHRRRPELSWSHHFLVSTLEPDEQEEWLQRSVDNAYSKHELEGLLHPDNGGRVPGDVTCPDCGCVFRP